MLVMTNETCKRLNAAIEALHSDEQVIKMNQKNTAFLEKHIFKTLREKAGMPDADKKEMINLSNYIDWSSRSGLKLNFTLTPEELMYVEIAIESQLYNELGAYPEQVFLPIWELVQSLAELSQVVQGTVELSDAKVFNKYAQKSKTPPTALPKFILYSGHTENVTPLLHALNSPLGVMSPPASSVYFKFYKCEECEGEKQHQMQVIYSPFPNDKSHQVPLKFSDRQDENGYMSAHDFD